MEADVTDHVWSIEEIVGLLSVSRTGPLMKGNPLIVGMVVVVCTITVAATIWLATEADIPTETAVPIIIVVLLAIRFAARRKTPN